MPKEIAYGLLISFLITGLFLGIQIKTGFDVSTEGLTAQLIDTMGKFTDSMAETFPTQIPVKNIFGTLSFGLVIIGIISIAVDIILVLQYGKLGIIIGISGFLGGLGLLFYVIPAFIIIFVGIMIAMYIDNYIGY